VLRVGSKVAILNSCPCLALPYHLTSQVILFERPIRPPTFKWPVVMRGKPAGSYNGARVSAWNVTAGSLASIITSLRSDVKALPKPGGWCDQ
jgi:hypothetical protein